MFWLNQSLVWTLPRYWILVFLLSHIFLYHNIITLLLQAPLYSDKAKLCPDSTFVIGYDTAIRLIMPKYYGGYNAMLLDLHEIKQLGCKLLVAGRVGEDSNFLTLEDVDLPEEVKSMVSFGECLYLSTMPGTNSGCQWCCISWIQMPIGHITFFHSPICPLPIGELMLMCTNLSLMTWLVLM